MSSDLERTVELQRRHIALLQQLSEATGAMSAAATPDEVATAVLTAGLRVLEAVAGFLAVVDEHARVLRVSRFAGYDTIPVEQLEMPLDSNLPIAYAIRMRTAVFIGSNHEMHVAYPGVQRDVARDHACASVPLMVGDDLPPFGAINIRFAQPRDFSTMDRRLLEMLGERCSQAMARAQRFTDERDRRITAEEALTTSRALEINDNIVQLIAEAQLATSLGLTEQASDALDRAMGASKRMVASMTIDAVTFRRDALTLDGILRVGDDAAASTSTPA